MKKFILIIALLILRTSILFAEEGMWIPMLLEKLNIRKMQDMGLKLTAEEIYSVNNSSLKDAIVQFGGGCTGGIVSARGLILTNHHCGYGSIQRHSSLEHDYLTNGFWATSQDDELPNPGLTVTLLVRMEDVTGRVLEGIGERPSQLERSQKIKQNIENIEKEARQETGLEVKVRAFYNGNQYFLIISEVFRDIRLVGAPPSNIGNFGGDTDNWMWPRHTGDFSVFRIYAGKDNKPAEYSKENVPYQPRNYLKISLKGYQKGDFTFVFGYPANTREYLPADAVGLIALKENPLRTDLRQKRLDIIHEAMSSSRMIRIQYASKAAGIANGWKKMIGESRGIRRQDGIETKREFEKTFQSWAESDPDRNKKYGGLLTEFKNIYAEYLPVDLSNLYITEAAFGIEIVRYANNFEKLIQICQGKNIKDEELKKQLASLVKATREFFKNYQADIDKRIMVTMLSEVGTSMNSEYQPEIFQVIRQKYHSNYERYAEELFYHSILADSCDVYSFLKTFKPSKIKMLQKDPAYILSQSIYKTYQDRLQPEMIRFNSGMDSLQRLYMEGQIQMHEDVVLYPDANSTLRVAFGKVDDLSPADGIKYNYFTTLAGVMQKEDSTVYDYAVDNRLKTLFRKKDFGRYTDRDSTIHVAFISSNHTTGGNSGSPVLNSEGQMIGINFDRNWEGTQSDLMYDPSQCRNISLDIRYCLFVIDKVCGAKRLTEEMQIVE